MSRLLYRAEKLLEWLCLCTGLFSLAMLIILRVYEIFSRNVLGESSQWFDFAESEAFLLLVFLSLALPYPRDAHVRVDVLRARWRPRTRARIEIIGAFGFVLPFAAVVIYYGAERVVDVADLGQRSALGLGAPIAWVIHASLPVGIGLFAGAVLLGSVRNVRFLLGQDDKPAPYPSQSLGGFLVVVEQHLPVFMLVVLAFGLFSGLPVAVILAGLGIAFSLLGVLLGEMPLIALFNIPLKMWGSVSGSLVYTAVVMLLLMGVALEKSGSAHQLLRCLQLLLRRVPGGLAVAVIVIGVILAPAAGLVGASVVTLTLIAMPSMLARGLCTCVCSRRYCSSRHRWDYSAASGDAVFPGGPVSSHHWVDVPVHCVAWRAVGDGIYCLLHCPRLAERRR